MASARGQGQCRRRSLSIHHGLVPTTTLVGKAPGKHGPGRDGGDNRGRSPAAAGTARDHAAHPSAPTAASMCAQRGPTAISPTLRVPGEGSCIFGSGTCAASCHHTIYWTIHAYRNTVVRTAGAARTCRLDHGFGEGNTLFESTIQSCQPTQSLRAVQSLRTNQSSNKAIMTTDNRLTTRLPGLNRPRKGFSRPKVRESPPFQAEGIVTA